jgi:N-methylhydantoinase B
MTLDPVSLTVIQSGLVQVCNEMDIAFSRAAFSPVIAEANDRSDGIYARDDGALIAQGELGLPIFVGTMQDSVRAVIDKIEAGETARPSPTTSTSSTIPISAAPTSWTSASSSPSSTRVSTGAGSPIPATGPTSAGPCLAASRPAPPRSSRRASACRRSSSSSAGRMDPEIYAIVMSNIRVADQRIGDIKAQAAALEVGARRLTALLDRYGAATVEAAIQELRAAAARQMRARIEELPDGSYDSTAWVDSDGVVDEPLAIRLTVTKRTIP